MTDFIKNYEELNSVKAYLYIKNNNKLQIDNIKLFETGIEDLKCSNPLIIAFGNAVYSLLKKHFKDKYQIVKVPHYSNYISKENYRRKVINTIKNF